MKIVLPLTLICGISEAWYFGYQPKSQIAGPYKYSLEADQYNQERFNDGYGVKPVVSNTYTDNKLTRVHQGYLQGKDKLIYRHPELDRNDDPAYIPVNRVKQAKVYLPPSKGGFRSYGTNLPRRSNNNWVNNNRYTSYSNGMRRPQAWKSPVYNTVPVTNTVTPQEEYKQVEAIMEESIANCLDTQVYNSISKTCEDKDPQNKENLQSWMKAESDAERLIYENQEKLEKPIIEENETFGSFDFPKKVESSEPKGQMYYDYVIAEWKYCPYNQNYNYRTKKCYEKVVKPMRWSWFG